MKKISFKIYSLGCKVNQYDGAVLGRLLKETGFMEGEKPDLVVINTCSVTQRAITKDKQLINDLRRKFLGAKFLIMGCWPQTDNEAKKNYQNKDFIFWGVGELEQLSIKIKNLFKDYFNNLDKLKNRKNINQAERRINKIKNLSNKLLISGLLAPTDRSRYFLKIADGCNQFCSYCLIPFARGRLISRSQEDIISEAEAATKAGYREIVLSGIHLGRYGEDFNNKKTNLASLLKKILKIKNLGRIRLSSIEINEVSDELIKLIIKNDKICRHLHISLQSGSDKILKLMKRPYNKKYFLNKVNRIKHHLPEIAISTDIIVGFPGENALDFKETYRFAEKLAFSNIHVFSFSAHKLTAAYKLPDKVSISDIKHRSLELRKLSIRLENKYKHYILKIYSDKPLKLIKEQSRQIDKIRAKTEFGFDLMISPKKAKKQLFI